MSTIKSTVGRIELAAFGNGCVYITLYAVTKNSFYLPISYGQVKKLIEIISSKATDAIQQGDTILKIIFENSQCHLVGGTCTTSFNSRQTKAILRKLENIVHKYVEPTIETFEMETTGPMIDKVRSLMKLIDRPVGGVHQYGPFALVVQRGDLFVIYDMDRTEGFQQARPHLDYLENLPQHVGLDLTTYTPKEFLAHIATGGSYSGFHDKMDFAMQIPKLCNFFTKLPSMRKINKILARAGFATV